jgi:type VI secretion system secreted protein Hcp
MAVDMFIKIGDIKGEAVDKACKDQIQILAWHWGMTQSGTTHTGSGGGGGKVAVQDLSFTHYIDKATPVLLKYCASGKHLTDATLTVRRAGGTALDYVKITMSDLIISSVSTGGASADDRITENVTLNFAKVKFEYTPQTDKGTGAPAIPMGWDIAANVEM